MKKINVDKSLVFDRRMESLKASLGYINQEGYFSEYDDFSEYKEGTLASVLISDNVGHPYENGVNVYNYHYFIPKRNVVFEDDEPIKYYRSFKTIGEFLTNVGLKDESEKVQFLEFRSMASGDVYNITYNGYEIDKFGTVYVHLGSHIFSLQELYQYHEYALNSFEWLPFGIECEKDKAELRKWKRF